MEQYAHNVTCVWLIQNGEAGSGKVLNITFTKFRIEQSPQCAYDSVELFDGPSVEYRSFGRFCGNQLPKKQGTFLSSFNSVLVRFRSDASVANDGFELNWLTQEASKCL